MKHGTAVALWRLLPLAAAVLAAHLLLLRAAPRPLKLAPAPAPAFIIRQVALAPTTMARAVLPPAAAPLRPVRAARSAPAAVPAELSAIAASTHEISPAAPATARAASSPAAAAGPAIASGAPSHVFKVPAPMQLHYQVTARLREQTWAARGELAWRHDGHNYEASLEIRAPLLPTRVQRSRGRITPEGLEPLRFSEKARSEEAAHFERDKGKVSFSSNRPDAVLLAGAQDRLSVMLQLGAMIAGEPGRFPPGAGIAIQTAGTRDAEPWVFTVEQPEELRLPGGQLSTLKLTRNPRREFDQKVELWLAPAMDYVPVRLRLTQPNGDSLDQQWSSTDRS